MTDDLDRMEAVAKAATRGRDFSSNNVHAYLDAIEMHRSTFDPPTVLTLIAELREARAEIADLRFNMPLIEKAATQRAEAEAARMRNVIKKARDKLHAYNRPVLREGLRIEVRDMLDAALEPTPQIKESDNG